MFQNQVQECGGLCLLKVKPGSDLEHRGAWGLNPLKCKAVEQCSFRTGCWLLIGCSHRMDSGTSAESSREVIRGWRALLFFFIGI